VPPQQEDNKVTEAIDPLPIDEIEGDNSQNEDDNVHNVS